MDCMKFAIQEHLEAYQKKLKKLPKNILFYRDGVGENQLNLIEEREFNKVI